MPFDLSSAALGFLLGFIGLLALVRGLGQRRPESPHVRTPAISSPVITRLWIVGGSALTLASAWLI